MNKLQNKVKIINIFYSEPTKEERKQNPYFTGLVIELENGLLLQQNSTDFIIPFSLYEQNTK